jgi:hypothetical protein
MSESPVFWAESSEEPFTYPDIRAEREEFEKVAEQLRLDPETLMFLAEEEGKLIPLTEGVWSILKNTDSNQLRKGDWETVGMHARQSGGDWVDIKERMIKSEPIDAPIIMKHDNRYYLVVAGNTCLMVSRALGKVPTVLMFEYKKDRTNE